MLYHVKKDLFGIKAGRIERFAPQKAGLLLIEGDIEPYDEKKHGHLPGAPKAIASAPSHKQIQDAPRAK